MKDLKPEDFVRAKDDWMFLERGLLKKKVRTPEAASDDEGAADRFRKPGGNEEKGNCWNGPHAGESGLSEGGTQPAGPSCGARSSEHRAQDLSDKERADRAGLWSGPPRPPCCWPRASGRQAPAAGLAGQSGGWTRSAPSWIESIDALSDVREDLAWGDCLLRWF